MEDGIVFHDSIYNSTTDLVDNKRYLRNAESILHPFNDPQKKDATITLYPFTANGAALLKPGRVKSAGRDPFFGEGRDP